MGKEENARVLKDICLLVVKSHITKSPKQALLEKAHLSWLHLSTGKILQLPGLNARARCGAPGDSPTFSNSKNRKGCAIPDVPLAWSSSWLLACRRQARITVLLIKVLGFQERLQPTGLSWNASVTSGQTLHAPLRHLPCYYHSLYSHRSMANYSWLYTQSMVTSSKTSGKWRKRTSN